MIVPTNKVRINTTVTEEQLMMNQQSLDKNKSRLETRKTVITEYEDPTQNDPHELLTPVDNQHTINEQPMRLRYGREIKPTKE
jgi:hypothetical protein